MKIAWKKKKNAKEERTKKRSRTKSITGNPNLPFERDEEESIGEVGDSSSKHQHRDEKKKNLAESFETLGNELAEDGKYNEALQKWEAAITLMPERAILHEQKAQVLLEIGDTWSALKAATRATELEPSWAEAWITHGRAQLNYGEPDLAIKSFDKALEIKPNHEEAMVDQETASHLVKKRKQLHSTDLSINQIRYKVGEKFECFNAPICDDDKVKDSNASTENQHINN